MSNKILKRPGNGACSRDCQAFLCQVIQIGLTPVKALVQKFREQGGEVEWLEIEGYR